MTESRVEVVVTVPDELPRDLLVRTAMRTTLGVLVELISESRSQLILASPFLQLTAAICRGPVGEALQSAAARGVLIDVVSTSGGFVDVDTRSLSLHRTNMSFRISQPRPNLLDSEVMGSHAKFCIVDGRAAYVGSANFTLNGLTKHFEVGTLVRGQPASDLWAVVSRMFNEGFFVHRGWIDVRSEE